jgi:hypothetical protein
MGATDGREPGGRIERVNALVQTLAILAAGAWGVYTFIYEARIKPGLEPPAVSVTTSLVHAGLRGERVAIRSTVRRRNVGQAGVRVLGLVYNVTGVRVRFGEAAPAAAEAEDHVARSGAYALDEPGVAILREGKLFAGAADRDGPAADLNPGEEVSRDLIVYADRSRYDFVRFDVSLVYTRDDDPPVRLRFEQGPDGVLQLRPREACGTAPDPCRLLRSTDFSTQFSLW